MSADEATTAEGLDLDEDLFNFDEITGRDALGEEDDADLDEIFATFQTDDDEEIGLEEPVTREPNPASSAPERKVSPPSSADTAEASTLTPPAPTPAPAAAPAAPVGGVPVQLAGAPAAVSVGMPRTMIWLFVALASVNAILAIVTLEIAGSMSTGVEQMTADVSETIGAFTTKAVDELDSQSERTLPISPPDPANHEAFDTASAMIEEGKYADARRVLYALLAVVDRMDPVQREGIESRANYLIAHAYQREAHDRIGGRR